MTQVAKTHDERTVEKLRLQPTQSSVTFIPEPDPEALFCPIISVDDHVLEPANLFENRLPSRLQSKAPFIEQVDARPWWNIEGVRVPLLMVNGGSGRTMSEWNFVACSYDEFRDGVWKASSRLRDMDMTGVWASLCFGSTIWGFAGTRFARFEDQEVGLACLRAYNDWMLDEWCGTDRDRFIPCQLPWLCDADIAAQEIRNNAERGFRSVSFSENPEGLGFPNVYDEYWDPFFRACEETETVINLHVGSSGISRTPCSSSADAVTTALFPLSGIEALVDWIFAKVPLRFPKLTIALSEAGVSWVPMAIERLVRAHRQAGSVGRGWPSDAPPPQDLVRRNFVFTSLEDPTAFRLLDLIGEDSVMVETDYPHFDSTWPTSQSTIVNELSALPAEQIRKVCFKNAARVYRHPLPPPEMVAASQVG